MYLGFSPHILTLQLFYLRDLPLRSKFQEDEVVEDGMRGMAHTPCENIGPIFLPA